MKILALESSAKAASVCLWEDGVLLAESYQNSGLTHSRTLLPMCQTMLDNYGHQLSQVDVIAVASGPGSFTGLRIGLSTAKGLAWPRQLPCIGVSTLEAMAWNLAHMDGVICCAMDARRKQVYNALFEAEDGQLTRLTPDRAISLAELFHAFGPSAPAAPACQRGRPCRMGADSASGGGKPPIRRSAASQLPAPVSGRAGTAGADEAGGRPGLKAIVLRFSG